MKKCFTFSIIGCGLTGTSMLYQLIKKLKNHLKKPIPIKIHVFEKNKFPGSGFPYDKSNLFAFHICNMPAQEMSIDADNPDDLTIWFKKNKSRLTQTLQEFEQWLLDPVYKDSITEFYPRMIMGEYLKERFKKSLEIAKQKKISVVVHSMSEVTNIKDKGNHLVLNVMDLEKKTSCDILSDQVLISTGHWSNKQNQPGYYASPWPAKMLLENIPKGSKVAVIGSGLSAIDTVLTLFSDGCFSKSKNNELDYTPSKNPRQITMYSRNGLLPKVRGKSSLYKNQYFCESGFDMLMKSCNGNLSLFDLSALLKKELEKAYNKSVNWKEFMPSYEDALSSLKKEIFLAKNGDNPNGDILWQTIVNQALPVITKAYQNLIPEHRNLFENRFSSVFMAHAAVMPFVNAQKILALMEQNLLTIKSLGSNYQIKRIPGIQMHEFSYNDDNGSLKKERFPYVIDARGQAISYRTNPSSLAKNLLASEMIQIEKINLSQDLSKTNNVENEPNVFESGSILIDPKTNRVISGDKQLSKPGNIYAVGMMTRGQIINASMARECVLSTRKIVDQIIKKI